MTYTPGGKGIAPRQSTRPKWAGLQEIERGNLLVVFKNRTGTMTVPRSDVEKYERMMGVCK